MTAAIVELSADIKLRRFCFLGSMDPVYVPLKGFVQVKTYLTSITDLCKVIDPIVLAKIFSDCLHNRFPVRRDEPIFVYAVYLTIDVKDQFRNEMRSVCNTLLCDDSDLFLFCKYARLIREEKGLKGFNKTVRKAVNDWYENKSKDEIYAMWTSRRGQYGFTHKILIKLCWVNDKTLGDKSLGNLFFGNCANILGSTDVSKDAGTSSLPKESIVEPNRGKRKDKYAKNKTLTNVVMAVAQLRITKSKYEALKIIQKFKLNFNQVPRRFLEYDAIVEAIIPSMTYMQLLKCWKSIICHFSNDRIYRLYQEKLRDKALRRASHVDPVTLLVNMHKLGMKNFPLDQKGSKPKDGRRMPFANELYVQSFDGNAAISSSNDSQSNMYMHITVNLQHNYKRKYLRNQKNMIYYEAALSLAFNYYKSEPHVDVFYWIKQHLKLRSLRWGQDKNFSTIMAECNEIYNDRNGQRLIAPIRQALHETSADGKKYYVFLCIVPTSGRGNPNHSSKLICEYLDKYRNSHYNKAKFIIVQLLKHRPSLRYSQTRVENILEICGLDEHTTTIIDNFINEKFC